MDILNFMVKGSSLRRVDMNRLIAYTRNNAFCNFDLDSDWQGIEPIVAQFKKDDDVVYDSVIENNCSANSHKCAIPWEVLSGAGILTVVVCGGDLLITNEVKINVYDSGLVGGLVATEASPGLYDSVKKDIESIKANIEDCVTEEELESKGYVTKDEVSGDIDLSGYVTKAELEAKGYATKEDIENIDLSGYVTDAELEAKGYLTKADIGDIDLSGYVTETELSDILSNYMLKSEADAGSDVVTGDAIMLCSDGISVNAVNEPVTGNFAVDDSFVIEDVNTERKYLIKDGVEIEPFYRIVQTNDGSITDGDKCIHIVAGNDATYPFAGINTQNLIDFSNYYTLVFETKNNVISGGYKGFCAYSTKVSTEPTPETFPTFRGGWVAHIDLSATTYTYTFDISNVTGEYYVGLFCDKNGEIDVENIYLT